MKYFAIIVSCFLILLSCKKNENTTAPSAGSAYTIKDYFPLKYGNYWVYENKITDTNNVVITTTIDSCYVKDSLFARGKWFYQIVGFPCGCHNDFYKDSANCIIRTNGSVYLKLLHNDTISKSYNTFGNEWSRCAEVMDLYPSTFTYNNKTYQQCIKKHNHAQTNANTCWNNRTWTTIYAPGVGIVNNKYGWINSCDFWEIKLLRFKVN